MNKTKRTLSLISGVSAIILGILLSGFLALLFSVAKACAETNINGGQGAGLDPKAEALFAIYTLLPLIISINGILIVKKKPINQTYRLVINITLIILCLTLVVLGFIIGDEIALILLSGLIPAIPAIINLFIKEKVELEEKEG